MSLEPEQKPATGEVQLTPDQRLDAYIATLEDKHEFDIMKDQVEFLIVKRSPDAAHSEPWPDNGWMLTMTGVDKKGVTVGIVEKLLDPKDETPARKKINLAETFAYTEEALRNKAPKTAEDLGGQALDVVGVESPDVVAKPTYVEHLNNLLDAREVVAPKEIAEVKEKVVLGPLVDSLSNIMGQAAQGEIKNGKGDYAYSAAEIRDKLKYFAEKLGNPDVDIANLLRVIPRSGGIRDTLEAALKTSSVEDVKEAIAASIVVLSEQPKTVTGSENPGMIEQPAPKVELPAQETEREMLERHLRDYNYEQSDLYAQHRKQVPNSEEAYRLEKQIRENKADSGSVLAKLRKLG